MSKEKYVYSNCVGSVYLSSTAGLDRKRCGQCGDTDTYLGTVSSATELRKLLSSEGYDKEYIVEVVEEAIKYDGIMK
ncbi:hypothetical protein O0F74_00515 [Staphylococcus pseudintermedius]|nr:hypothetical protein [Staphylococcus pseudintermedius]